MVILDRLATEFAVFIELRKEIGFFSNFRVILSDDFDNLTRERRVEFFLVSRYRTRIRPLKIFLNIF